MAKLAFSLCVTLLLCALLYAPAQARGFGNIEFSAISCGDFVNDLNRSDEETIGLVFMWLDGYLSGVTGDTLLNWRGMEAFAEELIDYCASYPRVQVLDAARTVGIN